mmetsp:Transcript_61441/g.190298  ORF Transcript_61441/g.190298 Transcript_61441/m.190298 type:complete len:263 (-) Transcript_61441:299-1087(-)
MRVRGPRLAQRDPVMLLHSPQFVEDLLGGRVDLTVHLQLHLHHLPLELSDGCLHHAVPVEVVAGDEPAHANGELLVAQVIVGVLVEHRVEVPQRETAGQIQAVEHFLKAPFLHAPAHLLEGELLVAVLVELPHEPRQHAGHLQLFLPVLPYVFLAYLASSFVCPLDNDPDDHIQHSARCEDDKHHKEGNHPCLVLEEGPHDFGPLGEQRDVEEGEHGSRDVPEELFPVGMPSFRSTDDHDAEDRERVDDDREQEPNPKHGGQ